MPKTIDGKPIDEQKWKKAKRLAAEEGHTEDYDYIVGIYKKMVGLKSYNFCTDEIQAYSIKLKGEKHYYISGFAATTDIDLFDDMLTEKCLKSTVNQMIGRSIKIDLDHEVFRDKETGEQYEEEKHTIPLGKVVEAEIKSTENGKKGIWINAKLNGAYPGFKSIWQSIKGKFLDAFSVAFYPIKAVKKAIGEKIVNALDEINLRNIALTGMPVNPNARLDAVMVKALNDFSEVNTMSEEVVEKKPEAELKPEEAVEETPVDEKVEEKVEEVVEEKKEEEKESAELKSILSAMKDENAKMVEKLEKMDAELKSFKEMPVFKSIQEEQPKVEEKEEAGLKSILPQ